MSTEQVSLEITFDNIANLSDQGIQLTMRQRQMDSKDLALALKGAKRAIQDRFYSNLSESFVKKVKREMKAFGQLRKSDQEEVRLQVVQTVRQLVQAGEVSPPPWPRPVKKAPKRKRKPTKKYLAMKRTASAAIERPLPELSVDEVNQLLLWFADLARREGILALEGATHTPDEFLSTGVRLMVDGTEPKLIQTILTTWMESLLHEQKVKYQKIIEGLTSIQSGNDPRIVEQRLSVLY